MALNVAEAGQCLPPRRRPDQLAIIDHELRFNPARVKLRQLLREDHIGNLLTAEFTRLGGERLDPQLPWRWFDDAGQGGGTLGALGSHLLDLARWTVGRIDRLSAQLQTAHLIRHDADTGEAKQVTADDYAHLQLLLAGADTGYTLTVIGLPDGVGMTVLLVGTQGALRLDHQDRLWEAG
ncbi:MAG: Gfo/Idh/MocA family oxidoreductase [Caldilineaceae bacterium]